MDPLFVTQEEVFSFYTKDGEKLERKTEVRFDPLTGESSRLVVDPGMKQLEKVYHRNQMKESRENCPLCPENLEKLTPVFQKVINPEGRIRQGSAVVYPNMFPYGKHNGVVVVSEEHYLPLKEFTVEMIQDAFQAAQQYIQQVLRAEQDVMYVSVNWNHLPQADGSTLHPQLHGVVSESATNYQSLFDRKSRAFQENHRREYLSWLYEHEKGGERWVGEKGSVAWIHAFAPKGHYDVQAIFKGVTDIKDIKQQDWNDFAHGLKAVFHTLEQEGLDGFNLSLTFSNEGSPAHARIIPVGHSTTGIHAFQTLHQEPIVYKNPEEAARKVKKYF
ncbi:hypothetical protein [Virgibacillus sediminis]|uniref:Galactose-1-phosphate uridylyltransferase n=1 Tax=Virgibacillus sediminis TaxID=202260 RepID=A0ABV7AAI7_9BACI